MSARKSSKTEKVVGRVLEAFRADLETEAAMLAWVRAKYDSLTIYGSPGPNEVLATIKP